MRRPHVFFLLVGLALGMAASSQAAPPKRVEVCETCAFRFVKDALRTVADGGEVFIHPGIYRERNILLDRPVQVIGAPDHAAVIDAEGQGEIFAVSAKDVTIRGLVLRGSGFAAIKDVAAIRIENTEGCLIDDNRILEATYGIFLAKVSGCTVIRNRLETKRTGAIASGSGIHVWSALRVTIAGNEVKGHRDGIYFEFVSESKIVENLCDANLRYGLHFMFSHGNTFERNRFRANESGVAVMYSKNIVMRANRFEDSYGPASYGLLLKDISGGLIQGNLLKANTTGMYVEGTTRTEIRENDFVDNGWAIRLVASSDENRFSENNFLSNTFELAAIPGWTSNVFNGNFWSQYKGLDLDHNGVGDVLYRPVSLSGVWVQTVAGASLLLQSFFLFLADQAEAVLPSLTPVQIVDKNPLMRRRQ